MILNGKNIVLGVTGGIAAYKIAYLASALKKAGADVTVIMTKNATEFITPLTFETITKKRCVTDTFARDFEFDVKHISIAKAADLFIVAPATANVIAKLANGIADDMLTTTILAAGCKKLIAPAMNTGMYENPVTQRNLKTLSELGFDIVEPGSGALACGDSGKGRLPDTDELVFAAEYALSPKDLCGKKVLVTAGPTAEKIDPVRYITNHSTGKMGYAIAKAAAMRGAEVLLVSGKTALKAPYKVKKLEVTSAEEMFCAVSDNYSGCDFIIKAAAVGDYRPENPADEKIKKTADELTLKLTKNKDILKFLGENKREGQKLCGFSMETQDLIENSARKLTGKNADMIVANSLNQAGAGFAGDTNAVTIITKDRNETIATMPKLELADIILSRLNEI